MYSFERRGPGKRTALLAILQAILLLSALVLAPATILAQDGDPVSDHPPQADASAGSDAAQAEPERKVRIYPKKIKLYPGGKKFMSAWSCRADIGASFGPDKEPGTNDDGSLNVRPACEPSMPSLAVVDGTVTVAFGESCPITGEAETANYPVVKRLE